ncbi:hypothetical protein DID88_008485 [Monilinia fructigena]|uniref:acireductone dioxygenase (Fe(2+)-requiring) n=1 Tax=Monilinia fructigena TaxID=38457 RepID=A0A395J7X6_9HELO|nr:hypothetical protein DID88_008485 [Monilinia fructigena]
MSQWRQPQFTGLTTKRATKRELHDSGRDVDPDYLKKLGILCYTFADESSVDKLASERGYKNRDIITVSPEKMDEEIRYIIDGVGFFDVRSEDDEWIRIRMEKRRLIILPPGINHRFTTDEQNYIQAMRLFQEEPKWTAINRVPEVEVNPFLKEYLHTTPAIAG